MNHNHIKISAVIITYNEEEHLEKCLASIVDLVDEIIVVDSYSNDGTQAICEKYKVQFIAQKFLGYKEQKNFAVSKANYNYILSLDGDEALSETLKHSINDLKKTGFMMVIIVTGLIIIVANGFIIPTGIPIKNYGFLKKIRADGKELIHTIASNWISILKMVNLKEIFYIGFTEIMMSIKKK